MNRIPYSEKLKDPRWQKKRLQVLEHAKWKCQMCGCSDKTLHVHHSYYKKGKEPWNYPTGALIAVCSSCHDVLHKTVKQDDRKLNGRWKLVFESYYPVPNTEPAPREPGVSKFAHLKAMLERADG